MLIEYDSLPVRGKLRVRAVHDFPFRALDVRLECEDSGVASACRYNALVETSNAITEAVLTCAAPKDGDTVIRWFADVDDVVNDAVNARPADFPSSMEVVAALHFADLPRARGRLNVMLSDVPVLRRVERRMRELHPDHLGRRRWV